ncbi:MAG: chromosomal replication initiator protein DnaA [Patescibacteria group bacterium]|jgi:chromosomal replication initiator protein
MNPTKIWEKALNQLQPSVSYSNFRVFFENTTIASIEETTSGFNITIAAPNSFAKQSLETKHQKMIGSTLKSILDKECNLHFIVATTIPPKQSDTSQTPLFNPETGNHLKQQTKENQFRQAVLRSHLKQDNTFENFAVSPTNEVAYAGAIAVAKNPGRAYNPLFLYGDVGVGKTHLMQAVGLRVLQNDPSTTLIHCMGEQFTNEIIEAIRNKKTPEFRNRYRKAKMLLIDDIQFIAGKNTVQEEFFHTFNAIQSAGGQIILTSDRPPNEIQLLEDRLRSRFEEGLTIDIQAPNFELRTAILLIKAKQMNLALTMDVAQTIANYITSTRKLQGFLAKLQAVATLRQQSISTELALSLLQKQNMGDTIPKQRTYINPREVIEIVSKYFGVTTAALTGPRRSRPIVVPRQYAMYILKNDLNMPLTEIGRLFGGRDHTTVMHAVDKVSREVSASGEMQKEFSTIRKQIYG